MTACLILAKVFLFRALFACKIETISSFRVFVVELECGLLLVDHSVSNLNVYKVLW